MKLNVMALNQHYGSSHILRDLTFQIPDKGCLAVLGRNGAGKTTLLKCLMGLLPATSGTIEFEGQNITAASSHRRVKLGIGYVPQGREIFANLSVRENLDIAMSAAGVKDQEAVAEEMVALFPVLGEMWKRRGGDLSGGQQQQLSIARALATRPSLLILDEPTEGIQPNIVQRIEDVISSLKDKMSILVVEQYFEFVQSLADNYLVISRGEVIDRGSTEQMDEHKIKSFISI
ncbi:MAG: urea ABC transporter ATP-binding subunit UrtE [Gammaproteobacteria bacterium]|nr:urea ABC transporter ATP-binding subunit UrtE [Gammaproteobacteria bacterium]